MTQPRTLVRSTAVAIVALLLLVGAAWAGNAISGPGPSTVMTEQGRSVEDQDRAGDVDDGDAADVEDQDEAGDVDDGDAGELDD